MTFNYEQSIWGKGYASTAITSPTSFRLNQALRSLAGIPAGGKVLELGSGAGQFIRSIQKLRPDLECHGCDVSETAIAEAKAVHDGVVYQLNGATLPYGDATLDAVLIFDVLEHVEDADAILREVYRTLKPDGVFYAFVPCEGDVFSLWNFCRRIGWKGDLTKKYAGHINYFSRNSLRQAFVKHSFKNITFRYSEHVLGQLLGFVAFNLMDRSAKKKGLTQINGEEYFQSLDKTVTQPGLFSFVKHLVNALVYIESSIFTFLPSPNVHSVVRK